MKFPKSAIVGAMGRGPDYRPKGKQKGSKMDPFLKDPVFKAKKPFVKDKTRGSGA